MAAEMSQSFLIKADFIKVRGRNHDREHSPDGHVAILSNQGRLHKVPGYSLCSLKVFICRNPF